MRLGIGEDHLALHDAAAAFMDQHCPPSVPRAYLDGATEARPPFWEAMARLGWLGIHLPAEFGGGGGTLLDLAVVLQEMGRALAPGPFLPTVLASAVIDRLGTDEQRTKLLPGLAAGTTTAAVACGDGSKLVLGADLADLLVLRVQRGGEMVWVVVDRASVTITPRPNVDETRRVADVVPDKGVAEVLRADDNDLVRRLATRVLCADAVGAAAWCVETAASHAQMREQFGRPIGQFQAVKHRCADMLCQVELAQAATWDALRDDDPLADAAAAGLAPDALLRSAEGCVQVLGGMGFTWEHDAHLYLKRALAVRALLGGSRTWRSEAVEHAKAGRRRHLAVELPPEADSYRTEVQGFLADLQTDDKSEWRVKLADAGYLAPHWPKPWGRGASALEQLVIDDEFSSAGVQRPHLQIAAWVLPTIIGHGSEDQQQRWIPPTLRGEVTWCQLFSEPGAGSDLASLATKATRTDGGWLLSGQKVWTTMANIADVGLCLARTDSSVDDRHDGISCFVVDMRAEGIDIRPMRELTGHALFNEVFFNDVFVPGEALIGGEGAGWQAARTTLGNERVSMSRGSSFGLGEEALLNLLDPADSVSADEVGRLLIEAQALAVLGQRLTLRAITAAHNTEPGPESSVRKLLAAEHDQKVQEAGWALLGRAGAVTDGDSASWVAGYLANRCLTIAGGTSEVQRNVIAEKLLGLPRDP